MASSLARARKNSARLVCSADDRAASAAVRTVGSGFWQERRVVVKSGALIVNTIGGGSLCF